MIRGIVNPRCEAVARLRVRGPKGIDTTVDAIIDSGFTASLTLPLSIVQILGLPRISGSSALLADGSVRQFDIFAAEVEWDGSWRAVLVSVVGTESLVGMQLLSGHKLEIEVVPGGLVEIIPLP